MRSLEIWLSNVMRAELATKGLKISALCRGNDGCDCNLCCCGEHPTEISFVIWRVVSVLRLDLEPTYKWLMDAFNVQFQCPWTPLDLSVWHNSQGPMLIAYLCVMQQCSTCQTCPLFSNYSHVWCKRTSKYFNNNFALCPGYQSKSSHYVPPSQPAQFAVFPLSSCPSHCDPCCSHTSWICKLFSNAKSSFSFFTRSRAPCCNFMWMDYML